MSQVYPDIQRHEQAVLCFVRKADQLLLIHKRRGLGQGKVNAPGGKIEEGESSKDAAIRETREETGIIPVDPVFHGTLDFRFTDGLRLQVDIHTANTYLGTMVDTDEAYPFWCGLTEIPWDKMWADDPMWLPWVLEGMMVEGRFLFDGEEMKSASLGVSPRPSAHEPGQTTDPTAG